jgi:branched-chain amino acid transport system substrate-binding protein
VIDKITGAGVVQISPANTSPAFTTYADKGLYFRTAPSDVLQGRVLGNTVLSDGYQKVAFLQLQDSYGDGLGDSTESTITEGGGEVVERQVYDPKATSFSSEVAAVKQANPDAIILIGFDETAKVLEELAKQNLVPTKSGASATPTS